MEGSLRKCVRTLVILGVGLTICEGLSVGGRHPRRRHSSESSLVIPSEDNKSGVSSLAELENKLDLILDSQSREKDLLEDFLLNNKDQGTLEEEDVSTIPNLHVSPSPPSGGILAAPTSEHTNGEGAIRDSAAADGHFSSGSISTSSIDGKGSGRMTKASSSPSPDEETQRELEVTEEEDSDSDSLENKEDESGARREKDNREVSSIIVKKLEENSKRMETMVVFLADLRNVLSEAVASQEKQVALRGEVVELRDEIDYLRKEVQKLRSEQAASYSSLKDPKLDHKIHNDETTIEWLKESVKELRHGMQEVSSSVNVTGLVHLRQHWDTEVNRLDGDLRTLRNDVESLKASQARGEEGILETKGDVADLRTWQIKMGQKLLQEEQTQVIGDYSGSSNDEEKQWSLEKVSESGKRNKRNFHTAAVVADEGVGGGEENGGAMEGGGGGEEGPNTKGRKRKGTSGASHRTRHQRKHKSELISLENVIRDVMRDQTLLHKRLVKLERKFAVATTPTSTSPKKRMGSSGRDAGWNFVDYSPDSNEIDIIDGPEQEEEIAGNGNLKKTSHSKGKKGSYPRGGGSSSRRNKEGRNEISNSYRINLLENSIKDYANTLQGVSFKLSSLTDLRESTKQLFTAMEGLETKYDERLTEMQTGLARLEASVSKTSITNDELKEQQDLETGMMQKLRKDFLATRDQVHTNHLRLAAVQSQLLKWGLKTCSDLSTESIQNIKIASLEARLEDPSKKL